MSWKSLFINQPEGEKKSQPSKAKAESTKMPDSTPKFPSNPIDGTSSIAYTPPTSDVGFGETAFTPTPKEPASPTNPACEPHMAKIIEMYDKGFKSLDMDGYDFFEFFEMVTSVDINNADAYKMAMTMASKAGKTPESLLDESKFYTTKLEEVHKKYSSDGAAKKQELMTQKTTDEAQLRNEISGIEAEISRLSSLKIQKDAQLNMIDSKYQPQILEVDCKILANDTAKDNIVGLIQKVVSGINSYLK